MIPQLPLNAADERFHIQHLSKFAHILLPVKAKTHLSPPPEFREYALMTDHAASLVSALWEHVPSEIDPSPLSNQVEKILPNWFRPKSLASEEIRVWLTGACRNLGITPSALATSAGLAASTLNRFVSGRTKGGLTAKSINALHEAIVESAQKTGLVRQIADTSFPSRFFIDVVGRVYDNSAFRGGWYRGNQKYEIAVPMSLNAVESTFVGFDFLDNEEDYKHPRSVLITEWMPNIDYRSYNTPKRIIYSELSKDLASLSSGWLTNDPSGFGWILPPAHEVDAQPKPLGRKTGPLYGNILVLGPVVSAVGFISETY